MSLADPLEIRAGHRVQGHGAIGQQAFETDQADGLLVVQIDPECLRLPDQLGGCFT